jgi:ferredoxin-type protein NapH
MVIESIPKTAGMVYAIAASLLVVLLFRSGRFNKWTGYALLLISTAFGFLVFAPMLPNQFQVVLLGNTKQVGVPVALAFVALALFVVMAFAFGRSFCGHVCPIGAVQELIYLIPGRKLLVRSKAVPIGVRAAFLAAFLVAALAFSTGLLVYLGVRDFFYLEFDSAYFYVLLGILAIGVFIYRPFCRFLCPYGALLSLAAIKSRLRLHRNEQCIDCGKCEKVCPTYEAGRTNLKQECYLCDRCRQVCPTGAIVYGRTPSGGDG